MVYSSGPALTFRGPRRRANGEVRDADHISRNANQCREGTVVSAVVGKLARRRIGAGGIVALTAAVDPGSQHAPAGFGVKLKSKRTLPVAERLIGKEFARCQAGRICRHVELVLVGLQRHQSLGEEIPPSIVGSSR